MIHLRLILPADCTDAIVDSLVADDRVTNVVVMPAAAKRPAGDVLYCDVAREATSDILASLRDQGVYDRGAVALTSVDSSPSRNARDTEQAAPGAPEDAVVWDAVVDQAYAEARGSWAFYAFLTLATMIAAVAVINDSAILVVGAMVVGPEFGAVAALAVGLALGRPPAAGDLALSIALWAPHHIGGSAAQLAINLIGMTAAGIATLLIHRTLWRRLIKRTPTRPVNQSVQV
ncbi:hypothetical protein [Kribbella sp. CA-294648]|uniref:hypothetical protein n=1 Tax=Kribbella sp. CA-294648 TaxID=3239948 RepID=UPI003D917CAD